MDDITKNDLWKLIQLKCKNMEWLIEPSLRSYHNCIDNLPHYLENEINLVYCEEENEEYKITCKFILKNVYIRSPSRVHYQRVYITLPSECRINNTNYISKLYADIIQQIIIQKINSTEEPTIIELDPKKGQDILDIPVMVGSKYCTTKKDKRNTDYNYGHVERECRNDPGGYFIYKGNEKQPNNMEALAVNKILVMTSREQDTLVYHAQVRSMPVKYNSQIQTIKIKMKKNKLYMNYHRFTEDIPLYIILRVLGMETTEEMRDGIVWQTEDKQLDALLIPTFEEEQKEYKSKEVDKDYNRDLACKMLNHWYKRDYRLSENQSIAKMLKMLQNDFLPHEKNVLIRKAKYLCMMTRDLLLCILKRKELSDRDSYINKRIETNGDMLVSEISDCITKALQSCRTRFSRYFKENRTTILTPELKNNKPPSELNMIQHFYQVLNTERKNIETHISTGTFSTSSHKNISGGSEQLQRMTYLQALSSYRRVKSSTGTDSKTTGKKPEPHRLHNTQYGRICAVETPEGPKVGQVKNLALTCDITVNLDQELQKVLEENVYEVAEGCGFTSLDDISMSGIEHRIPILMNGLWLGFLEDPISFVNEMRYRKCYDIIDKTVSIYYDYKDKKVHIFSDRGRLIRPLLRVKDNKLLITREILEDIQINYYSSTDRVINWDSLLLRYPGIVEYLDVDEEQYAMVALNPSELKKNLEIYESEKHKASKGFRPLSELVPYIKYSHCEISEIAGLMGIVSMLIPFSNYNQSPRCIYQCAMSKQGIGISSTNYKTRMNTTQYYTMERIERPIVGTKTMDLIKFNECPNGQNAIVAFACYTGFNQEDSLIMNGSSIDRGIFQVTYFQKKELELSNNQGSSNTDMFTKPDPNLVTNVKNNNYDKLDERGIVPEETYVDSNDILIGRVTQQNISSSEKIYKG